MFKKRNIIARTTNKVVFENFFFDKMKVEIEKMKVEIEKMKVEIYKMKVEIDKIEIEIR